MTHEFSKDFSKKHPAGEEPDPRIAAALEARAEGGEISCVAAFELASDLEALPGEVGRNIDLSRLRIVRCQLGLFGYKPEKSILRPAASVPTTLEAAIRGRLSGERLSCEAAWRIAAELGIGKLEVAGAAEALRVHIKPCQLGAF